MCYLIYRLTRKKNILVVVSLLLELHLAVFIQSGIFEAPEILPCGFERWSPVAPFAP